MKNYPEFLDTLTSVGHRGKKRQQKRSDLLLPWNENVTLSAVWRVSQPWCSASRLGGWDKNTKYRKSGAVMSVCCAGSWWWCFHFQVIAFLRKKDKFISLVLKHIDTSAMMDLLLRLISCVEPATLRQEVLNVRICFFFLYKMRTGLCVCLLRNIILLVIRYESGSTLLRAAFVSAGVCTSVPLGTSACLLAQSAPGSVAGSKGFSTRFSM